MAKSGAWAARHSKHKHTQSNQADEDYLEGFPVLQQLLTQLKNKSAQRNPLALLNGYVASNADLQVVFEVCQDGLYGGVHASARLVPAGSSQPVAVGLARARNKQSGKQVAAAALLERLLETEAVDPAALLNPRQHARAQQQGSLPSAENYLDEFPACQLLMELFKEWDLEKSSPLALVNEYAARMKQQVEFQLRQEGGQGGVLAEARLVDRRSADPIEVGRGHARSKQTGKQVAAAALLERLLETEALDPEALLNKPKEVKRWEPPQKPGLGWDNAIYAPCTGGGYYPSCAPTFVRGGTLVSAEGSFAYCPVDSSSGDSSFSGGLRASPPLSSGNGGGRRLDSRQVYRWPRPPEYAPVAPWYQPALTASRSRRSSFSSQEHWTSQLHQRWQSQQAQQPHEPRQLQQKQLTQPQRQPRDGPAQQPPQYQPPHHRPEEPGLPPPGSKQQAADGHHHLQTSGRSSRGGGGSSNSRSAVAVWEAEGDAVQGSKARQGQRSEAGQVHAVSPLHPPAGMRLTGEHSRTQQPSKKGEGRSTQGPAKSTASAWEGSSNMPRSLLDTRPAREGSSGTPHAPERGEGSRAAQAPKSIRPARASSSTPQAPLGRRLAAGISSNSRPRAPERGEGSGSAQSSKATRLVGEINSSTPQAPEMGQGSTGPQVGAGSYEAQKGKSKAKGVRSRGSLQQQPGLEQRPPAVPPPERGPVSGKSSSRQPRKAAAAGPQQENGEHGRQGHVVQPGLVSLARPGPSETAAGEDKGAGEHGKVWPARPPGLLFHKALGGIGSPCQGAAGAGRSRGGRS